MVPMEPVDGSVLLEGLSAFGSDRLNGNFDERQGMDPPQDVEMTNPDELDRYIIAIDFGTTFSSVAYARTTKGMKEDDIGLAQVHCVARYPGDKPFETTGHAWEPREDVPTELWYTTKPPEPPRINEDSGKGRSSPPQESMMETDSDSDSVPSISFSDHETPATTTSIPPTGNRDPKKRPYWGFEIQDQLRLVDAPKHGMGRLIRFKLMLDKKDETAEIRKSLATSFKALKRHGVLKSKNDIIADYLTELFSHTKRELEQTWDDFGDDSPIEFVLCIPAVWPAMASRVMQSAMSIAAKRSKLCNSADAGVSNLFIVSEPEAAAECVLEETTNEIQMGDTIVVVDAGGGTIDAITYEVTSSSPLRLSAEAVPPSTELCGASYINERFAAKLHDKLKNENYLNTNQKTIDSIVEAKVIEFENTTKRFIDLSEPSSCSMLPVYIDNLKPNVSKGLYSNRLFLSKDDIKGLYRDSLTGTATVLKTQLKAAKQGKHPVKKVILIGGFSRSPSLYNYLKKFVDKERNVNNGRIDLICPSIASTAVARGAVLRAHRKANGPDRITNCSYGFRRTEPHEPDYLEAHKKARCMIDPVDGEKYVDNTIYWLIQKGSTLVSGHSESIPVTHTFAVTRKKFICKEILFVSDETQESHYRIKHKNNEHAEVAGEIIADMTFLREQNLIQPVRPRTSSKNPASQMYYEVEFDLKMTIDGRNLYYEALWPPKGDSQAPFQQTVQTRGQICIAAAFQPGTA